MSAIVRADRGRCIGAGQCVRVAPDVFDQDEKEGLVVVVTKQPQGEALEHARHAERLCPAQAIQVHAEPIQTKGDTP
ncbi:MAG: ferredoxin [Burkholderiales bacterium]